MIEKIKYIIDLANDNPSVVSILIFILTLLIGWSTGIFRALMNKPKLKATIIDKCTFYAINYIDKEVDGMPVYHFAFCIYLRVNNIGYAPTDIVDARLQYQRNDYNKKRKRGKNWIKGLLNKGNFELDMGHGKVARIPYLKQKDPVLGQSDTYLEVGKSTNGILYFEEEQSYGNFYPRPNNDKKSTDVVIELIDSFGEKYKSKHTIQQITYKDALSINEFFAKTYPD